MLRGSLLTLALLLLTGCRSNSTQAALSDQTPDQTLVQQNQKDGLGLAFKLQDRTFHTGQQIPLHIALEDISSRTPIAAGLCSGLALAWTNQVSNDGGFVQLNTNPHCFHPPDPDPDEQALPKGKLLTFDVTGQQYAPLNLPPGLYQMNVSWQRYPAGPVAPGASPILTRRPGQVMMSNPITVTITP